VISTGGVIMTAIEKENVRPIEEVLEYMAKEIP